MHLRVDTPGADKAKVFFNGEDCTGWNVIAAHEEEGWIKCVNPGNAQAEYNGSDVVVKELKGKVRIEMPEGAKTTQKRVESDSKTTRFGLKPKPAKVNSAVRKPKTEEE